ncbi:PREDICTED: uncharacterized protein LOC108793208 [Nanorana parkeri]|uniref:uncharacterized protein LOC108793208 n=1 Tax=Nanorana parkeri TaxID=125878 RepID=UPI000854DE05|nr:PREDICTED: uncharacterized protein LOC108793208 [Nanorana parkeri]
MMEHYHSIKPLECTVVGSGVVVKVEEEEVYSPRNDQNPMTNTGGASVKREVDVKAEEGEVTCPRRKRKSDRRKRTPVKDIGSVNPKPEIVIKTEDDHEDSYARNDETFKGSEDQSPKTRTGDKRSMHIAHLCSEMDNKTLSSLSPHSHERGPAGSYADGMDPVCVRAGTSTPVTTGSSGRAVKPKIEVKLEDDDQSYVMADQQFEERDSSPAASPDYFLVQIKEEEEEDMSFGMDYQQHGDGVVPPETSSGQGEAVREKDARIHRMSSKMFIDIAQLIQLVQERPELYNPKTPSYADRYKKKKAWDEICAIVVPDWELCSEKEKNIKAKEVQTRWRSLKDCFRRELTLQKKLERSGIPTNRRRKYIHYDGLLFLEPTMKLRDTFTTTPATPNVPNDPLAIQQPIDVDQVAISPPVQPPLPLPLRLPPAQTLVRASPLSTSKKNKKAANKNENEWERQLLSVMSTLRKKTEEQSDADEIFLKSLLPFVKKVPEDRKIDMQLSLMHVVKKFMGPVQKEPQTPNCQSGNSTYVPPRARSCEQNSPTPSRKNSCHARTSPRPSHPAYEPSPIAPSQTSSFNYSREQEALPVPQPFSSPSSSSSSTNRSPQSQRDSPYYFDL